MSALPLMEMFETVQGEGHHAGAASFFIRLGGCDVGCVWCDVKESWDPDAHPQVDIADMVAAAEKCRTDIVVITGGEPAMYDLTELTSKLHDAGKKVHIETSGAHPIRGSFDWITLSPKKFKFPIEGSHQMADELKVIVFNKSDFKWAEEHSEKVRPSCLLYLQPEWDNREKVMSSVVEYVTSNPEWKISLQDHKYMGIP